jgi:hypothetical protein
MDELSHWFHEHAQGSAIGAGVVAGLLVGRSVFSFFWDEREDFYRAITYFFQPDLWSFIIGEYRADRRMTFHLTAYLALCGGVGYLVYRVVHFELLDLTSVVRTP